MTEGKKDSIAQVLITQKFSRGDNIVNEGDPASSYYIIKEVGFGVKRKGKSVDFEGNQRNQTNVQRRLFRRTGSLHEFGERMHCESH